MSALKNWVIELICGTIGHNWLLLKTKKTSTKLCARCGKQEPKYE